MSFIQTNKCFVKVGIIFMKQKAERREQISQYLQPYMEECFRKTCNSIQTELDCHASEIWTGLRRSIKECFDYAGFMQQQKRKGRLQYLVFSFLQCGVYFERLELRIDFLDDGFYLDEQESVAYYYPDFLQEKYVEDISFLQKKAGEKFVRLQNYERIDIKREYSGFYQSILFRMIESLTGVILELIADYKVLAEEDFKIIFGEYMGTAKVLYEGVPDR